MFGEIFKFSLGLQDENSIFTEKLKSMDKDINRLKVILTEKKKTNRWLASQLGKDESTISKWCTNTSQPSLEQLKKIANVLDTNVGSLLCDSYINDLQ